MGNYQWNSLTDEKEFEDLVNILCSKKYGLEFQIYGRKGQKQYGIDGSALTKDNKHILYQCKNKDTSRSANLIQKELLKDLETETNAMIGEFMEKKTYIIDKFIFANSGKRDTKLQGKADELSRKYNILVIVWSWDEISDMLEEYIDIAQKFYPNFFRDKVQEREIKNLSNEKSFLDEVFHYIQGEEPIMLLSMTPTPYHNKIAKHYKKKIYNMMIEYYSKESVFLIQPPINEEISQVKYFSKLAKDCYFDQDISDGDEFIEALDNELDSHDICLLISEFENGSDKYRKEFALALRPLLLDNTSEYSCSIVIFGRKKLASLSLENEYGMSPLNYFEELLIPTPTIDDYKEIENTEENITNIYNLTGGHPELMKFCFRREAENYQELILNSRYGYKFFRKYHNRRARLLTLFEKGSFGQFSLWSHDELIRDLFWDNLIVEDANRFKWIAPIVVDMGKRYFI